MRVSKAFWLVRRLASSSVTSTNWDRTVPALPCGVSCTADWNAAALESEGVINSGHLIYAIHSSQMVEPMHESFVFGRRNIISTITLGVPLGTRPATSFGRMIRIGLFLLRAASRSGRREYAER